jgi:RNA-directed DNA polymerase
VQEVVDIINPILSGWVNYFRIGNSGRCFNATKDWVEGKVRRHIYKAKQKRGFGWKRWSTEQLYQYTELFNNYKVKYNS